MNDMRISISRNRWHGSKDRDVVGITISPDSVCSEVVEAFAGLMVAFGWEQQSVVEVMYEYAAQRRPEGEGCE